MSSSVSSAYNATGIESSTVYQKQQAAKESSASGETSKLDFLQLLTVQLTNQDPLNPMEDIDFTAQLAQLEALDQQMEMTKTMTAMRVDMQVQAGTAMIGKFAAGTDSAGNEISGLVTKLVQNSDGVHIELANGKTLAIGDVTNVWDNEASMNADLSSSADAIDMFVVATDAEGNKVQGIVEKVSVEEGVVKLTLYGGETVDWSQVNSMRSPTDNDYWYLFPDEIRLQAEAAQTMVNKGVTGKNDDGKTINGIVAGAELDGDTVYLVLYSGERINISKVDGEARNPTADDAAKSLAGYEVSGLDEDGNEVSGIVTGADEDDSGMYVTLDNGGKIYFDAIESIADPDAGSEEGDGDGSLEEDGDAA